MSEFINNKLTKPSIKKSPVKAPRKSLTIVALTLLTFGFVLMPTGFVLAEVIQGEIDKGIVDAVTVPSKHSSDFDEWVSNDYDDAPEMYATFYLWNLTNPDEFKDNGDKPVYEEIGPFVFRLYNYKYDIRFSDDNEEVTYKQYSKYVQIAGDDISVVNITNINPGFLGSVEKAGGTPLELFKMSLPAFLYTAKETFVEMYLEGLQKLAENTGPLGLLWFLNNFQNYTTPGLNELDQSSFPHPLNETSLYDFSDALPAESIWFEKWANDYFPDSNQSWYWNSTVGFIHADDLKMAGWNMAIREILDMMLELETSAGGTGVDLDGLPPYNFQGKEADLNISEVDIFEYEDPVHADVFWRINKGGSNITQEQCQTLWNESNPNSLTGFDYETNKVWFDALEGDIESRQFLNDTFGLNTTQLILILDWLNVSINTWAKNNFYWGLDDMGSWFITTRTVEEWLFTANDTFIYEAQKWLNEDTDISLVGLFDNCHNTAEAEAAESYRITVKTGRNDISEVGQVVDYKGEDKIYIWAEPIDVEGTFAMQFGPEISEEDTLKVFNLEFMRVVDMEYDEPDEIYDIDLLKYEFSEDTFSPNPLYFQNIEGLVNLQSVERYLDVPVRASRPHFLGTPLSVQQGVIGMRPNSEIHDTYFSVEPITGLVMEGAARMQVNFEVKPDDFYLSNISNTIMPILWGEESGEITEDLAEKFKDLVYGAIELKEKVPLMFLGIGAAICVPGVVLFSSQTVIRRKFKKEGFVKGKDKRMLTKIENYFPIKNKLK